jgi:hypothetical protein
MQFAPLFKNVLKDFQIIIGKINVGSANIDYSKKIISNCSLLLRRNIIQLLLLL